MEPADIQRVSLALSMSFYEWIITIMLVAGIE
jgi:hypothetical protein